MVHLSHPQPTTLIPENQLQESARPTTPIFCKIYDFPTTYTIFYALRCLLFNLNSSILKHKHPHEIKPSR